MKNLKTIRANRFFSRAFQWLQQYYNSSKTAFQPFVCNPDPFDERRVFLQSEKHLREGIGKPTSLLALDNNRKYQFSNIQVILKLPQEFYVNSPDGATKSFCQGATKSGIQKDHSAVALCQKAQSNRE